MGERGALLTKFKILYADNELLNKKTECMYRKGLCNGAIFRLGGGSDSKPSQPRRPREPFWKAVRNISTSLKNRAVFTQRG